MNFGTGAIIFTTLPNPGTVPPFVPSAADNGLSVDPITGHIVFGQDIGALGDPAQFLSNREVPLNGFTFNLTRAGNPVFFIDPVNSNYIIGDTSDAATLFLDGINGISTLGDTNVINSNLRFSVDTLNSNAVVQGGASLNRFLLIDLFNQTYSLGDIDNEFGGSFIQMSGPLIDFLSYSTYFTLGELDFSAGIAVLGDNNNSVNGTKLTVDDLNNLIDVNNVAGTAIMRINGVPGFTGTVTPVTSITVIGGIVTAVS